MPDQPQNPTVSLRVSGACEEVLPKHLTVMTVRGPDSNGIFLIQAAEEPAPADQPHTGSTREERVAAWLLERYGDAARWELASEGGKQRFREAASELLATLDPAPKPKQLKWPASPPHTGEARIEVISDLCELAEGQQALRTESGDALAEQLWAIAEKLEPSFSAAPNRRAASPPHTGEAQRPYHLRAGAMEDRRITDPSTTGEARVERIIGICRNPAEPFYWDADRIGEPCPGCACWSDDINPPNHQHEFYVQVEPASTPEPEETTDA